MLVIGDVRLSMAFGRAACARLVGAPHMLTIRTYTNYEHVFTASAPGHNASVEHQKSMAFCRAKSQRSYRDKNCRTREFFD